MSTIRKIFGPLDTPFALGFDEWDEFDADYRRRAPIRYFVYKVIPRKWGRLTTRTSDAVWWIRHRTINRHHIVNTGLAPGYYDKDRLMLWSCFAMLERFIEREGVGFIDWESDPAHSAAWQEIQSLYAWWKSYKGNQDDENVDMEDANLCRLVAVRRFLWT